MTEREMTELAERFLQTWTDQDVDAVLGVYTEDVSYVDPNTRGAVEGSDAMRRYLTKLFANWTMTWHLRELHPFASGNGCSVLWHATFRRVDGETTVEADGMDHVEIVDGRIKRNEVYFDRAIFASLM